MDTGQVLKEIPDLTRDSLYSWEALGYISSNKELIGKKGYHRKDYPPGIVDKLKKMIEYYKQGMPPRKASEEADREMSEGPTLFNSRPASKKPGQ